MTAGDAVCDCAAGAETVKQMCVDYLSTHESASIETLVAHCAKRKKHNPEKRSWKGKSYKKSKRGKRPLIDDLKDKDAQAHNDK